MPEKPSKPAESARSAPAASSSGGPTFAASIIGNLLELTERRLQQLVKEGWIPRAERGQYSLRDSVRGYIRYLKEHNREQQRGQEQARLARAQATKVEIENYRRMGELQVSSQVDDVMQGLIVMMKSSHESLPGRLASELAAIADPPLIYQRLQTELRAVCNLCADYLDKRAEALASVPEPVEAVATVDAADADDVGAAKRGDAAG